MVEWPRGTSLRINRSVFQNLRLKLNPAQAQRFAEGTMATQVNSDIQVQAGLAVWSPPSSVTDHLGGQLSPDRDFFVAPPREIGEVVKAYTSLKRDVEPKSAQVRMAIVAVAAGVGGGAGVGLDYLTGIHTPLWYIVIGA